MKFGEIRKPLMLSCLAASVAFHAGAVWYFSKHPFKMELQATPSSLHSHAVAVEQETFVEKMEKALEESFNTAIAMESSLLANKRGGEHNDTLPPEKKVLFATTPQIRKEEWSEVCPLPHALTTPVPTAFDPELQLSLNDFALDDAADEPPEGYKCEVAPSVSLGDFSEVVPPASTLHFFEDDYNWAATQYPPSTLPSSLATQLEPSLIPLQASSLQTSGEMSEENMLPTSKDQITHQLILPNSVDYLRQQWIKRSIAENTLPDFTYYGLDELCANFEWEEGLDVEVALMPDLDRKKYIFSLTLQPDFQTNVSAMRQHFLFVIDRSSSVEKSKFNRYKRAVQRSLAALCEGDTFNICFLDKNIEKLAHRNLPVTPQTIEQAEEFLDRENAKTHFAATEIYQSLDSLVPQNLKENELYSVILISDGNTMLNSSKQKKALSSFSDTLNGNVNFYTASSGKGNNLVLLDLLSYVTGGKLIYSETNAGFPRKLVRLVKELHHPLVKNLSIDISCADQNAEIKLSPRHQLLPPLFAGQPYTITGTVSDLSDLAIYIQGTSCDRVLNIHKNLSLKQAQNGGRSLEKKWASSQSKVCYEHFLKNGKHAHLTEAKHIVTPYKGEIAHD